MATPGQLVRTMADTLGVPVATVAQYDRQLAEAGLRTVSGRGTSAAKVTASDAANLLIALLGSPVSGPSVKAAPSTCKTVGSLSYIGDVSEKFPVSTRSFKNVGLLSLAKLGKSHTFKDALAAVIEGVGKGETYRAIIDGEMKPYDIGFSVIVDCPLTWVQFVCTPTFPPSSEKLLRLVYDQKNPNMRLQNLEKNDLRQERRISFRTIQTLGDLISTPVIKV